MKQKDSHVTDALRDSPVPPVKGAVTDQRDVVLRPEGPRSTKSAGLESTMIFDGWL